MGSDQATPRLFDGRRKEWFSVDNIIVDEYLPKIGDKAFSLYCVLARFVENSSGKCFPRQSYLEELLGWSNSTVRRALRTLIDHNLLARVERWRETDGGQMANDYYLVDVQERSSENRGVFTDDQGGGPEWTAFKKTHAENPRQEVNTNPDGLGENAPPAAPEPEPPKNENLAPTYIAHIARKLEDATVPLDAAYKMRFGKDVKAALKKGVDPEVLDMAVARIIERWDDYQLSLRQAMTDITNKKTTTPATKKNASPQEAIERIRNGNGLARYAGVAEQFDFTDPSAHPPWYVMKELGGDANEQQRNLQRIRALVGWEPPKKEPKPIEKDIGFDGQGNVYEYLKDGDGNPIPGSEKLVVS